MLIRLKFGRYAGTVQDVAPDVAANLIKAGRAIDANRESEEEAVITPSTPTTPAAAALHGEPSDKRKRGKR